MKRSNQAILAIFAHPDDESYRAGGFLSLLAHQGIQVHVLTATQGEVGLMGVDNGNTPASHSGQRGRELRCACRTLGLRPPRVFDFPDGRLMEIDPEKLVQKILLVAQAIQPQVLLSFGPDGLSGHPDHIAIGNAAGEVYRRYQKAGAFYQLAVPVSVAQSLGMNQIRAVADSQITLTIDVTSVWDVKLKAIQCHASQIASSPIMRQSEDRKRLFLGIEHFVRAANADPALDFVSPLLKEHFL